MPLQFKNIAVGNLQDDVSGNNYAANKAVYILNLNNTLAQIFSDEAGTTPIVQDGVNNVTGARGVFGFWVEAGDYFVQVGANKYRVSITGADYFNNRIDETVDLIVDAVAGRGAYYPVGSFEAGFTYTDINQVGTFGGTDYYIYTGGLTNLPHNVTAGTNPTLSSDYAQVFFGEINNVQGLRDELNNREKILPLSDIQSEGQLSINQYFKVLDRGLGLNKVVDISDTGGAYLPLDASKKLKLEELSRLTPSMFGPMTNPTERTSSLSACLSFATLTNGYYIELDNGVYDPIDITQSDVLIVTSGKPVFTLPENTVTALDTVPVSALTISGDDVKIYGDLYTDGNSATNDSSGYNLSNRRGELHIAGANFELHGTLHTLDAHYVGFSFGNETDTASRPYIDRVVNHKSASYIASIWSADEWVIGGIVNKDEVQGFDNRVYTGNQSSSTKRANRGFIGYVIGKGTYCVYEVNTVGLYVGYMDVAGWKSEDTKDFKAGEARSIGTSFDAWGFGVIQSENFQADSIVVDNYQGLQPRAVQISSSTGRIGSLTIDNNQAAVSCEVFTVPDGFTIVNMDLNGRNGTDKGLVLPSGQARTNFVVCNLNSRDHVTSDVDIATYDPDNIKILNVNSDIVISSAYDEVKRRNIYQEGTDTVQMTATSGTIALASDNDLLSWTKQGREVTIQGRLVVSSTTGSGALRIAGVNTPPSDLPEASGEVPVTLYIESLTGSPAGIIQAKIPEGSTDIIVTRYNNGTVNDDVAGFLQAGSRIVISARYVY